MLASDQGTLATPPRTATTNVFIGFVVDKMPTFTNLPITQPVSENVPTGSVVYTVEGNDADLQVSPHYTCSIDSAQR